MSDRYLVISSDCHAGLRPEAYRDYLDPQYREAFDQALPIQQAMMKESSKTFLIDDINEQWRRGNEELLHGAWDHDARLQVLDGDGIAGEIIFPDGITEMNSPPFGASLGLPTEGVDPELQWAGARAHNRWLAELCSMAPERHFGLAVIPALWDDMDTTLAEVRKAREAGLGGILLPNTWGKRRAYHDPFYEPLWALCEDLGTIIHFHSGAAPTEDYFGPMPPEPGRKMPPGAVGIYITEVPFYAARPVTFMLWGGVFTRYPKLKVAITEGTAVWVPEYVALLEQRYAEAHYSQKLGDFRSHLKGKSPAQAFRENVFIGASCMPRREAELRHKIGLDQIMWGSDYPHPEGSWPFTRDQMHETFHGLPEHEVAAMLGGNAAAFYGFDSEKLAPLVDRIGPEKSWLAGS
jgi:predicted TIM-barrel fold metal-dependent hydrolase